MTKFTPQATTATALQKVAQLGLAHVDFLTVKDVALDVWHSNELPDLSTLPDEFANEALFLVERLTYYSVVPQQRKKALLQAVRLAGGTIENMADAQLESAYEVFLPLLQPLQTRHYKADQAGTAK